jgi:hypothetical protein
MFGDTITLAYAMQPGEKLRYKTEVISEQSVQQEGQDPQGFSSTMEMVMVQEGKGVSPNGDMEVEVTIEDGHINKGGGQTEKLPTIGTKITIVMKKSGEIVRTSVDFPFSQPAFPEKQLKVGDTWTGDSQMDIPLYNDEGQQTGTKKADLTYHYTLSGLEQTKGYDTAVINVSCPETRFDLQEEIQQSITATGVTYFGHKTGRLVKSQVSTKTEITAPGTIVGTKIKVVVELQEATGGSGMMGGLGQAGMGMGIAGGNIGGGGLAGMGGDDQFIIS